MKKRHLTILLTTIFTISIYGQDTTMNSIDSDELIGQWKIDLRPTPDSEAYYQYFVVSKTNDNTLEGTFYGSPIKNGLINKNWERLYFAFSTSDSSNDYYHSGYILDGRIYGVSYCPNREFTTPWQGIKEKL